MGEQKEDSHLCLLFVAGIILGGALIGLIGRLNEPPKCPVCPAQNICKESIPSFDYITAFCKTKDFDGGFLTMDAYNGKYTFSALCRKEDGTIKSFGVD